MGKLLKISMIALSISLIAPIAHAFKPKRTKLKTSLVNYKNQTLTLFGGSRTTLRITELPYEADKVQISKASSKSSSTVSGRRNKDIERSEHGSEVDFNIVLSEDSDFETFKLKTFTKVGEGYEILDRVDIAVNLVNCTKDYKPVCAQEPAQQCSEDEPGCEKILPAARTFTNACQADRASADILYKGECS